MLSCCLNYTFSTKKPLFQEVLFWSPRSHTTDFTGGIAEANEIRDMTKMPLRERGCKFEFLKKRKGCPCVGNYGSCALEEREKCGKGGE